MAYAFGPELPRLETDRLVLRGLAPGDVPALFGIFSDPEVTRYWSSPPLRDLADAAALVSGADQGYRVRQRLHWGIARRSDDQVIGTCSLSDLDPLHRRARLDYALSRPSWHQGYAGEALPVVVRFAFAELELHRLEADVDPRNIASIRALGRLGFQREGYLRERYLLEGEIQDALMFGLLRTDPQLV